MSDEAATVVESPSAAPTSYCYRFANVVYDEAHALLTVDGRPVPIEPRPLHLLATLLRRVDEVVSKEELFETLWTGRATVDNVLANAVTKLRKALGEQGAQHVVNLPRVGYRLSGPVERYSQGEASQDAAPIPPTSWASLVLRWLATRWGALVLVLAVGAVIGFRTGAVGWQSRGGWQPSSELIRSRPLRAAGSSLQTPPTRCLNRLGFELTPRRWSHEEVEQVLS